MGAVVTSFGKTASFDFGSNLCAGGNTPDPTVNIVIRNQIHTQRWWVAFWIEDACGSINNVEITDDNNYMGTWIAYTSNEYGYYSFDDQGFVFTTPLTVRI